MTTDPIGPEPSTESVRTPEDRLRWIAEANEYQQRLQNKILSKATGGLLPADVEPLEKAQRRGRLPKEESDAKRAQMLATLRQHCSLKDDICRLADMVGVSESTARRWLEEEEQKYRESKAARPESAEE